MKRAAVNVLKEENAEVVGGFAQRRRVEVTEEDLVHAVKVGQRTSPEWKEAWGHWCESHGEGTLDPAKYDAQFLREFLANLGAYYMASAEQVVRMPVATRGVLGSVDNSVGQRMTKGGGERRISLKPGRPAPGGEVRVMQHPVGAAITQKQMAMAPPVLGAVDLTQRMPDFVKMGQKKSEEFKQMWNDHCNTYGQGTKDPRKHNASFFTSFLFLYGISKIGSQDWTAPYLQDISNIAFPFVVATIKHGQRMRDEEWVAAWQDYCNNRATNKGTFDPARQDPGSLFQFIETVAIPDFSETKWMKEFLQGEIILSGM